jgi:hypothetical protein
VACASAKTFNALTVALAREFVPTVHVDPIMAGRSSPVSVAWDIEAFGGAREAPDPAGREGEPHEIASGLRHSSPATPRATRPGTTLKDDGGVSLSPTP